MNRVAASGYSGCRAQSSATLTSIVPHSSADALSTMASASSSSSSIATTLQHSMPSAVSQAGNVDPNPQHPLAPLLKSIMDELRKIGMEVKKVQDEQKRVNGTLTTLIAASFAIETSPYKVSNPGPIFKITPNHNAFKCMLGRTLHSAGNIVLQRCA